MRRRSLSLALVFGCAPAAPDAALTLRDALVRVSAGDPGAWALCEPLPVGGGQGECRFVAAPLQPDRAAACRAVAEQPWRDECWFELAESHARAARWDVAVEACAATADVRGHCARHLWSLAVQAERADPALRARIDAAFPEHTDEIAIVDADYRALSADVAARGGTLADGRSAPPEATPGSQRVFRDTLTIDPSVCGGDAACLEAARAAHADRWRRVAARNPALLADICAGGALPARLDPGDDPRLRAQSVALRAELCAAAPR